MKTEENKRMEALAYIIADLKAENIVLAHRVHYNYRASSVGRV